LSATLTRRSDGVEAGVAGVIKGRSKPPGKKPILVLAAFPERNQLGCRPRLAWFPFFTATSTNSSSVVACRLSLDRVAGFFNRKLAGKITSNLRFRSAQRCASNKPASMVFPSPTTFEETQMGSQLNLFDF
jgi:hypothetical protein